RPQHAKDVAVDLVGMEHLDALAREESRQANPLTQCPWAVRVPQRHVHEPRPRPLVTAPQRAVRLEVHHRQLKTLGAQTLGPPHRVELGAADLEVIDAEREPNHRSLRVIGRLIDVAGVWLPDRAPCERRYCWSAA